MTEFVQGILFAISLATLGVDLIALGLLVHILEEMGQ